jgi:chemotaxis signal transduction protein
MVSSTAESGMRLVCFELRGQELALPIADVRETLPVLPITRVFLVPACLAGVFSLRGDIVPVIDLGILLGLPATVAGDDSKIVVIDHAVGVAGVVVDRLRDLRTINERGQSGHAEDRDDGVRAATAAPAATAAMEPPPPSLPAEVASLLLGVVATPTGSVRVLDARAVLTAPPLRALARAEEEGRTS